MRFLKKILKGILIVLLLIIGSVGLILGKEYIESKRIEHIVKSDEAKEVIEKMIREEDNKALTPEGKIRTYKIDFDKVKRNPMGGINIRNMEMKPYFAQEKIMNILSKKRYLL